jgi:hypothetical protein
MTNRLYLNEIALLLAVGHGCSVDAVEPRGETSEPLTRTQDEFLALAVHDALCYCEALLITESTDLVFDTSLGPWYARYIQAHGGGPDTRTVCEAGDLSSPVRTMLPDKITDPGRNACAGVDGSLTPFNPPPGGMPAPTPGLCRAELNYCLGHELRLRADALVNGPPDATSKLVLLTEARTRHQLAAAEYASSFALYAGACQDPHDAAMAYDLHELRLTLQCNRFDAEPELADIDATRMTDAIREVAALLEDEAQILAAMGDAVTRGSFTTDADYASALWGGFATTDLGLPGGIQGVRFQAAERLAGVHGSNVTPGSGVSVSLARAFPQSLHASAVQRSDRAAVMLSLMEQYRIPAGLQTSAGFQEGLVGNLTVEHAALYPSLSAALYNLLDHRIAASWRIGPYEAVVTGGVLQPDPPGTVNPHRQGDNLRAMAPLPLTDLVAQFGAYPLAASLSPLRQHHGLGPSDMRDAQALAGDVLQTMDVNFARTSTFPGPGFDLHSIDIAVTQPHPSIPLAARLTDLDMFTGVASSKAALIPFGAPAGYTGYGFNDNWYSPPLSTLAQLGAAGALHLVRVQLHRLEGLEGPDTSVALDPEQMRETRTLLEGYLGTHWTEFNEKQLICDCSGPLCPPPHPFNDDCSLGFCDPVCPGGRYVTSAYAVPRWDIVYTNDEFDAGTFVATSALNAACLRHERTPGAPVGSTGCDTPTPLVERMVGASTLAGAERRQFEIASGLPIPAYILWQAPGTPVTYRLVDVLDHGNESKSTVHALGGELLDRFGRALAKDPLNPVRPLVSSLGLAYDLVPPLEYSLAPAGSDDVEASVLAYLDSAEEAAGLASGLLATAREMEIDVLHNARADEALSAQAELAERAELSELCGGDATGGSGPPCVTPRRASITMGELTRRDPSTGAVVPFLPPIPDDPGDPRIDFYPAGSGPTFTCIELLANTNGLFQLPGDSDDWDDYVETFFRPAIRCTEYEVLKAVHSLVLRDIPERVIEELASGGIGDFADLEGAVRDEHIRMFSTLEEFRTAIGDFKTEVEVAYRNVEGVAEAIDEAAPNTLLCVLDKVAAGLAVVAAAAGAIIAGVVTFGAGAAAITAVAVVAFAGSAASASAGVAGFVGSLVEGCPDEDAARAVADQGFGSLMTSLNNINGLLDTAGAAARQLALGDSALDSVERRASIAQENRAIQQRIIATNALADVPEWNLLRTHTARRGRDALFRAKQRAFVARRAIEFRFGHELGLMTVEEPFVPAPSDWTGDLFLLDTVSEADEMGRSVNVSAEAIVDHVRYLRAFMDGYPFGRRFREGRDRQVLNLSQFASLSEGGRSSTKPFYAQLSYGCDDGSTDHDTATGSSPCNTPAEGGVSYADVGFFVPADLGDYLGDRLARDNYNYRVRNFAINLVGSALLNCEDVPAYRRDECYRDGNIQYQLRQEGGVSVENHDREIQFFRMEPGVIERARALAAERALTNPLTSEDATLLTPYTRYELWGRPLVGTYRLRIYSRDELDWSRLEDVQVLVEYEYWTRQE